MSNFNLTPSMGLPNPVPGVDPGPDYSLNLQTCLNIVDAHNHAAGSGVQINPNGIDINAALPFNGNPATLLGYLGISPQGTGIATPINDSIYCSGVDLYFQDGNGNAVRITSGGGVNATSSGISSGTNIASFVSNILVVDQSAGVGAAIDAATYILRYNGSYPSPAGNYILLSAPSSLATGYQITFPGTTPASSGAFLTSNTSGTLSYTNIDGSTLALSVGVLSVATAGINTTQLADGSVTPPKLAALGQQISASSGTATNFTQTFATITNCSVSITTTGRPVLVGLQSADTGRNASGLYTNNIGIDWQFRRSGSAISTGSTFTTTGDLLIPASSLWFIDTPGAGTYTYDIQYAKSSSAGGAVEALNVQLVVYEL